jgi:pimeloyl-ACP methyl ester carboxylesterase
MRSIQVGNADFAAHVCGPAQGQPIVLLHPWFGCWRFWCPTVERLRDRRVIAPDWYTLSGAVSDAEVSPQTLAAAVVELLDGLDVGQVAVVGNSVGGIVTQVLALDYPERVDRIVLVGTGASTADTGAAFAAQVSAWIADPSAAHGAGVGAIVRSLVHRDPDPQELRRWVDIVEAADPGFVAAVLRSCRDLDLRPRLREITVPALVVRGAHDRVRSRAHTRELLAGIPNSRSVELSQSGHAPMVDDPDAFVATVQPFLDANVSFDPY